MIKQYKDYWIGFLITAIVGATILALKTSNNAFPIMIEILLGTIVFISMSSIMGLVILGGSWIFTKNFSFLRFLRISVTLCAIWTLISIVSLFQEIR